MLKELGLIRKPTAFMSSISDDRGEELLYAGMPISDVFKVSILRERERESLAVATGGHWNWWRAQLALVPAKVKSHDSHVTRQIFPK